MDDQENRIPDRPCRPSEFTELRSPVQPVNIQKVYLDDTVIINEDRT